MDLKRPERIIQFGEGGFLRGFFDWMLEKANECGVMNASAVIVQPIAQGRCRDLSMQDCVYTHVIRGVEGVEKTTITCVSRCVEPYRDYRAFLDLAHEPSFRFVVSNTTESGIAYSEGDRLSDCPPSSFPAKVCALLYERYKAGLPGWIFLPCELIEKNGTTLRKIVLRYASEWGLGSGFVSFVEQENVFMNTLVDRIVTGFPKNEDTEGDRMRDTSEYFHLWVIEGDRKYADELPFDKAGLNVIWTDDLSGYRTRKVRILNGAHTSLVPFAMLRGFTTVRDAVNDAEVNTYLRKCVFEEIIPSLDLPKSELVSYAEDVFQRFANPYIDHQLSSIALNSVDKFKVRVLPSILSYEKKFGEKPKTLMTAFSSLVDFYRTDLVNDSEENVQFMRTHEKEEILRWMCHDHT